MKLADHAGILLARRARTDSRIVVLDGDLADSDGASHFAEAYAERFLMAGIAEQGMVSMAAGMASTGLLPFVFSFAAFLCYRAYDQIRVCVSQTDQPVTLVGSHAGGLAGRNGKTHTAVNDLALMLSLPGMRVFAPADYADVAWVLEESLARPCPTYIRLPRCQFSPGDNLLGTAGRLRWLYPQQPMTIVSTGLASHWALKVADELRELGLQVGVLHCLHLSASAELAQALHGCERLITLEDHSSFGGLGSLVTQLCPEVPVLPIGWSTEFGGKSGADQDLRQHFGLSSDAIANRILATIG